MILNSDWLIQGSMRWGRENGIPAVCQGMRPEPPVWDTRVIEKRYASKEKTPILLTYGASLLIHFWLMINLELPFCNLHNVYLISRSDFSKFNSML